MAGAQNTLNRWQPNWGGKHARKQVYEEWQEKKQAINWKTQNMAQTAMVFCYYPPHKQDLQIFVFYGLITVTCGSQS